VRVYVYIYTKLHYNMAARHNKVGNACYVVTSFTLLLTVLRHTRLADVFSSSSLNELQDNYVTNNMDCKSYF
jgi:hypothetical protein